MRQETREITLKGGVVVEIPVKFKYAKCRGCKADDIIWATTKKNKKPMPIRWSELEEDWISHFADCKNPEWFKKGGKYEPKK